MTPDSSVIEVVDSGPTPTCPLCHTTDTTISAETLRRGGSWRCTVCRQMWSATRLETVVAYAKYTATH